MPIGWIKNTFSVLPGTNDELFQNLWKDRRFLFDKHHNVGDVVDEWNARLVAAVLKRRERLLIVLPDFEEHRPALLFATGLIRHFLDSFNHSSRHLISRGPVLYFGTEIGIRDQLSRTSVSGLQMNLRDVFSQQDVSRKATGIGNVKYTNLVNISNLPQVITVYAPAEPVSIIQAYKPNWIAIDCSDSPMLLWLRPLLNEAARCRIPVIAWGQNTLSECVNDFTNNGYTFTWPPLTKYRTIPPITKISDDLSKLLYSSEFTYLTPSVLQASWVVAFSALLRDASKRLARSGRHVKGAFGKDAVSIHWKYLRYLETLTVPIDFYEVEASRFWGLKSFNKLRSACDHFRNACLQSDPSLYRELEEGSLLLNEAKIKLESHGCPLWDALVNLCIEDHPDSEARILVFTSDSRKRLFLLAMLARCNTTEDDLYKMQTYVVSLSELRRWMHSRYSSSRANDENDFLMPLENTILHPILVGLPSPTITSRLLCIFLHPKVDIVLYPHQCASLLRRQDEWSIRLNGNINCNVNVLSRLSGLPKPSVISSVPVRLVVNDAIEMNIETTTKVKISTDGPIWAPENDVSEVARLFQSDEESSTEEMVFCDQTETDTDTSHATETLEELWCAEAVMVQFDQGWHTYFAQDDVINVVKGGVLDRRYIRSLGVGEQVLLIHGQQRQSLYDLIISRVHKHSSIELHLAMIRRWQEDLRVAFKQWQTTPVDSVEFNTYGARDLNGLLRRIQARGSFLIANLTLSFWLRGLVLCPLDPDDLRRVAEVLDMSFVRQHYKRIGKAAHRLRGLHRGLSLKLNRWLQDHATEATHKSDEEVIDDELGLTFGDMQNSLLLLRVVKIENVNGPFLRSNLGRAEKDT